MGKEGPALALTALALMSFGCGPERIPIPKNLTQTPSPRPPAVTPVETRLIPPSLPTNTQIPSPLETVTGSNTVTVVPEKPTISQSTAVPELQPTKEVQQREHYEWILGLSSVDFMKNEVIKPDGRCPDIFGDTKCAIDGYPAELIKDLKNRLVHGLRPVFIPKEVSSHKPTRIYLFLGSVNDLRERFDPNTMVVTMYPAPQDKNKTSIVVSHIDLVEYLHQLFPEAQIVDILASPTLLGTTIDERQTVYNREIQQYYQLCNYVVTFNPKPIVDNAGPNAFRPGDAIHLQTSVTKNIFRGARSEAEERLIWLSRTPTPAPFVPTPSGAR